MSTTAKCKKHPFEKGPGVCASCLRDRLLNLIVATQSASASAISSPSPAHRHYHHRSFTTAAAPSIVFPRSVSPYVSHRRSVDESPFHSYSHNHPLFYSTPQIGPTKSAAADYRKRRFSLLSALFRGSGRHRSRSEQLPSDQPYFADPDDSPTVPARSSSSSWFSSFIPGLGRSSKSRPEFHDPQPAAGYGGRRKSSRLRSYHVEKSPDLDLDDRVFHSQSEYSTTEFSSSPAWRIPGPTPLRRHQNGGPPPALQSSNRSVSFTVCLSPLVRAKPQRRSQMLAGEVGYSGDLRVAPKAGSHHHRHRHASDGGGGGTTLVPNRSRKLADFGRFP